MEPVIAVDRLTKRYGGAAVVDGICFEVGRGEIFGILGRNGAGKTTTVECLQGLRRSDGGRVLVLGLDPMTQAAELRVRIGSQLQESALPHRIKVWEALVQVANHSTDHRAQIMAGLHRLGAPTMGQDFLDYLFETRG